MVARIEVYESRWHFQSVFELWMETLGTTWPLADRKLRQTLDMPNSFHFVAYEQNNLVGFIATSQNQHATTLNGHISVVLVTPQAQRQGVGTALHEAAFSYFRTTSVQQVQLGGGEARFWPGVPQNLPGARAFFERQGWVFSFPCYDLVQDIRAYATPRYVRQRMLREGVRFETATAASVDELLDFEQREFPQWLRGFRQAMTHGDYSDLLLARDQTNRVIGSLFLFTPLSHPLRRDVLWNVVLGSKTGAMACVGIADAVRGRGVGLALVVRASEILRERGVEHCYIDWVVLTDFYAKLGYQIWRGYDMVEVRNSN